MKIIFHYIIEFVKLHPVETKSEALVINSLKGACKIIPVSLSDQCNSIITENIDYLLKILINI